MAVVATAGHVDHGKSALVRALTGMEPDRWAEERRRGMTIDLGYAWFEHAGQAVALVDVPGHERFVGSMLAGVGPAPAVLLVVAADEGWSRQTQEHAAAVAALGEVDLVLVVTRSDLADPAVAQRDSILRLAALGISPVASLSVSVVSGRGLDALRDALVAVGRHQHEHDGLTTGTVPARLWVDRSFSVSGAGTVVTGTLVTGTVAAGQPVHLAGEQVAVRGLQSHGAAVDAVAAPARLAVNLRSVRPEQVHRGDVLTWEPEPAVQVVDVRVRLVPDEARNSQYVVGRGRGARPGEARDSQYVVGRGRGVVLHVGTAAVGCRVRWLSAGYARITLERPVQLRVGDRGVLRDPGRQQVLAGATVLALDPPPFVRRGEAAARAAALAGTTTTSPTPEPAPATPPDEPGLTHLLAWLAAHPLDAPLADQVSAWGPSPRALAVAATEGRLLRHSGLLLHPDVHQAALRVLTSLEAPFTVGEATRALGTTRRVSVPVLERLDALGHTQREPDGRRRVVGGPVPAPLTTLSTPPAHHS